MKTLRHEEREPMTILHEPLKDFTRAAIELGKLPVLKEKKRKREYGSKRDERNKKTTSFAAATPQ